MQECKLTLDFERKLRVLTAVIAMAIGEKMQKYR